MAKKKTKESKQKTEEESELISGLEEAEIRSIMEKSNYLKLMESQKPSGTWKKNMHILHVKLPSENKKKYNGKIGYLNLDFLEYRDNLITEIKDKTINKTNVAKKMAEPFKQLLWRNFNLINDQQNGLLVQINKNETKIKSLSSSKKADVKTINDLKAENLDLESKIDDIIDQVNEEIFRNYRYYYEWNILSKIMNGLAPMRKNIAVSIKKLGGSKLEDGLYVIEDGFFKSVMDHVKYLYKSYFEALSIWIKKQYILWATEPDMLKFVESKGNKTIKSDVAKFHSEYDKMLEDLQKNPNTKYVLDRYDTFVDQYDTINKIWKTLTEEQLEKIIEQMNSPNLTIKRKKQGKGYESNKEIDVHWYSDVSPAQASSYLSTTPLININPKKAYPYIKHIKQIAIADEYRLYLITAKQSLLLHEIDDDNTLYTPDPKLNKSDPDKVPKGFYINIGTKTNPNFLLGFEALFDHSFTEMNTQAIDPQTESKFINIQKIPQKITLNQIKLDAEQALYELKNNIREVNGVQRTYTSLEKAFQHEMENDWLQKYENTKQFVNKEEIALTEQALRLLKKEIDGYKLKESVAEFKKISFTKDAKITDKERNTNLASLSEQTALSIYVSKINQIDPIAPDLEILNDLASKVKKTETAQNKILFNTDEYKQFAKSVEQYSKLSESDKKNNEKVKELFTAIYSDLIKALQKAKFIVTFQSK